MTYLLSLFYVGPHQIVPVIVGLTLWIGLAGLGYLVTGRDRIVEGNAFFGWAVVSTVFVAVGVFLPGSFAILSVILALLALAGIVLAWRRGEQLFVPGSWRIVVLALPVLWIAGAMDPSQWDEFSHWLPAPMFLLKHHGFPTGLMPYDGPPILSAYPYGWPFLHYLSGLIAGRFVDNIGGILNLLMLLSFAVFALRSAFAIVGRPRGASIGWPFAAAAALVATAFNPTFVQKIVLTAYSDVSSSVLTGVAILIGYELIERLARRKTDSIVGASWQLALVLALLVYLRQPNLVVLIAIMLALALVAWRDPDVSLAAFGRYAVVALAVPVAVYALWRWYVAREFGAVGGAEATLMPFELWNIAAIPKILGAMAGVAFKKFAFFAPMILAVVFAVRALIRCRSGFDRMAILTAFVFLAYNAFLLFTYVAHFGYVTAISVVSYWRYNIDVGMIAVIFITLGVLAWWSRHRSFDVYPRWLAPVAIVLVLVLPAGFVEKLRFDLEPPKPHFMRVAKDMKAMGLTHTHYVLDPTGTGEAAVITRVLMDTDGKPWLGAFHDVSPAAVKAYAEQVKPGEYLLVHSIVPGFVEVLGQELSPRRSYLFRRDVDGWELLKSWEKPADHPW